MNRLLPLALCAAVLGPAACLPGPETLLGDANLELVLTGLTGSDTVAVDVAAAAFSRVADDGIVRFFLTVPPGPQSGSVVIDRDSESLCATFSTVVPADGRVVVGLDAGNASACKPPKQDREVVSIGEVVVGGCNDPSCTTETTVNADGEVVVQDAASTRRGIGRSEDKVALFEEALSEDADALFRDGCERGPGAVRETVEIKRSITVDGEAFSESVDITNCRLAIANRLRAHLGLLRSDL
jgi:hypothetical protein